MKIVIVAGEGTTFEKYRDIFRKKLEQHAGVEVVWMFRKGEHSGNFMSGLQALAPDILVTTDLLGFEQCTLTDGISYNLLNCKQIHLLLRENPANEKYLEKQLSMAMFFYCAGDDYCRLLRNRYPDMPWLKTIPGWQIGKDACAAEKNAEILSELLGEVAAECGIDEALMANYR